MVGTGWDPAQYERFQRERTAPFHDLAARVRPGKRMRVLDLGCGTGELTRELHRELAAAETLGLDSSLTMLARSDDFAEEGLSFRHGHIERFEEGGWDLVLSNAALHWLDDHEALLERLVGLLAPGGQLAIQVPANHDYPTHVAGTEVAQAPPFRDALSGYVMRSGVLEPVEYARHLHCLGLEDTEVRLRVYAHELPDRGAVLEWVKGAYLTAYQQRLPKRLWESFLGRYQERLYLMLKDERPFFYPFKRILLWGTKPLAG